MLLIRLQGGGAEESVRRIIDPLSNLGVSTFRVACRPGLENEEYLPLQTLAQAKKIKVFEYINSPVRLRKIINLQKPDLIHLHCERPELIMALTLLISRRARSTHIIITEHSMNSWGENPRLGRFVRKYLSQYKSSIISCFENNSETKYVPNPIDDSIVPLPTGRSLQRIVVVGRLAKSKRINWIIQAVSISGIRVKIVVIGDGPEQDNLQALDPEVQIEFRGFLEKPWDEVQEGDLFISASSFEGEPLSVVEAITKNCPMLISDIPAHKKLDLGEEIYFSSQTELAEKIKNLFRGSLGVQSVFVASKRREELIAQREPKTIATLWKDIYTNV